MTREREQFLFGPFLGEVITPSIPYSIQRRRRMALRVLGICAVLVIVTGAMWGLTWGV